MSEFEAEQLARAKALFDRAIATGVPSALLCVLAAGVLASALAGHEVSVPQAPTAVTQAVSVQPARVEPADAPITVAAVTLAGRHALLADLELQALQRAPQTAGPAPGTEARGPEERGRQKSADCAFLI